MATTNPYAPPRAYVKDIADPRDAWAPADRGTRLGAAFLDGIIFGAMVYAPIMVAAIGGSVAGTEPGANPFGPVVIGGGIFALVGLIVWSWLTIKYVQANGQSIAKKLLNIKVVRSDGSPVSLARMFWLRNVVNALLAIIPLYGLIDPLFIFGESRRCLHDKLADTIVIQA